MERYIPDIAQNIHHGICLPCCYCSGLHGGLKPQGLTRRKSKTNQKLKQ